jgi:N-acylneuraminate cytidylyltransferase
MSVIAIITARGGSKRIPKKNIKDFYGKPMLAYAIDAAKKADIFDEIMVSTDSLEIAEVAKKWGAAVPFMRSAKTSDDYATTYDVLEEVLAQYNEAGKIFDFVCCIYPCVPFLAPETLLSAYNQMQKTKANAIMPVCQYPAPIEWAMRLENGFLQPDDASRLVIRSQDLKPAFFDAGMFYFCKTDVLLNEKTLVPPETQGYIIDERECQDIDTPNDWEMAELKYKLLRGV